MTNYKGPPPVNPELVNGPTYQQFPTTGTAVVPQILATTGFVGWPQDLSPAQGCDEYPWHSGPCGTVTLPPAFQMPTDDAERKKIPLGSGVFDCFTAALIEVAKCSHQGNVQHYGNADNLQWVQGKSNMHFDCLLKHAADRGTFDTDGVRHTAKLAWRALAMLQMEMQEAGAPLPRSAR